MGKQEGKITASRAPILRSVNQRKLALLLHLLLTPLLGCYEAEEFKRDTYDAAENTTFLQTGGKNKLYVKLNA